MPFEVVIAVSGGVVQDVFCDERSAEFIVVDWDAAGAPADEPALVRLRQAGRMRHALVQPIPFQPLHELAGSETERAIEAAFEQGVLPEPAC